MAKLTRVFQALFGRDGNQSHFGQFGSRAAGLPVPTKDPSSIQSLSAFITNGWLDAINAANKAPFLEDMNGLFLLIFRQIAYGFQEGVCEWDAGTTYYTGSIVKKTGTFELYGSLVDNNIGNALPSKTTNGFWSYLNPPSVAPGIMSDFGGTVAPLGYLLCDGSVYAQATYPDLFTAIGTNWNTGGEGAGNFRVPDIRGRATLGAGTGAGLSPRTLGQKLGEETHLLVNAEVPVLSDLGHRHPLNDTNSGGTVEHLFEAGVIGIAGLAGNVGAPLTYADTNSRGEKFVQNQVTGISYGGGSAHNIMQPSAVVTKIIKT